MTTHRYHSGLSWSGRTEDYETYSREHAVTISGHTVPASADSAFRGDAALPNPEELLLAAASSCQLLSFLAVAARSGVTVLDYQDDAEALMPEDDLPVRVTRITLRPRIVATGTTVAKVERLLHKAHGQCYIANSLTTDIVLEPEITVE